CGAHPRRRTDPSGTVKLAEARRTGGRIAHEPNRNCFPEPIRVSLPSSETRFPPQSRLLLTMLVLPGVSALSPFRNAKLLSSIQSQIPAVRSLTARFVHFADCDGELTVPEQEVMTALLDYGSAAQSQVEASPANALLRVVVPRPGTISPWSSKATDILHNSGLERVRRLERGIAFRVELTQPLEETVLEKLDGLLHDRMTQAVLPDFDSATV